MDLLPYIIPALITVIGNYLFKLMESRGVIAKKRLDDIDAEATAFELSQKYGKKVLELEARLTHTEEILGGDLNLNMKVPMVELLKNGSAPFTGMAHIVKREPPTQPVGTSSKH